MDHRADGFDEMIELCIRTYRAVQEHGTAEMQSVARALLIALAYDVAQRAPPGEAEGASATPTPVEGPG